MIPRTGSLGLSRDSWAAVQAACYANPEVGHAWKPPQELANRLACTDEAWDAGFGRDPELCENATETVPFDPKCLDCRRAARRVLEHRGLTREQMVRVFRTVGAKWEWTTAQKDRARREADHGEFRIDDDGKPVTTLTLKARKTRLAKRIEDRDRKARRVGKTDAD